MLTSLQDEDPEDCPMEQNVAKAEVDEDHAVDCWARSNNEAKHTQRAALLFCYAALRLPKYTIGYTATSTAPLMD